MSSTLEPTLPATEQQLIDQVRAAADQLSPAGFRKLLTVVARKCLPTGTEALPLTDDQGEVFAYLRAVHAEPPAMPADLTREELAAIKRNLFDPKKTRPWRDVLAQLEAEDDRN
jgi:hypothetical protein